MKEMQASEAASQFVEGLDYPISKDAIVAAARKTGIGPTVQNAIDKLPDREYAAPEELTTALTASS